MEVVRMSALRQSFPAGPRAVALGAVCLALFSGCQHLAIKRGDPSGRQVARSILKAIGGARAAKTLDYVSFRYSVEDQGREVLRRDHLWDRKTGRCRLDDRPENQPRVALFNRETREGISYLGSTDDPQANPDPHALAAAHAWHVRDTFWLMSAAVLLDLKADLEYVGEQEVEGRPYPTLKVSFGQDAGVQANDVYWYYADPSTGRPKYWAFVLRGRETAPRTFAWKQWQTVGKLSLPVRFEELGHPERAIVIDNLYAPGQVREEVFRKP